MTLLELIENIAVVVVAAVVDVFVDQALSASEKKYD